MLLRFPNGDDLLEIEFELGSKYILLWLSRCVPVGIIESILVAGESSS